MLASLARRGPALAAAISLGWAGVFAALPAGLPTYAGLAAFAAAATALLVRSTGWRWRPALRPDPRRVALGLALGLGLAALTHAAYAPLADVVPGLRAEILDLQARSTLPWAALPLLLLIVVGEEIIWRGVLVDALHERGARPAATWLVAALAYGAAQLGSGSLVLGLAALTLGLLWDALRRATGSLAAPLATHAVWTVAMVLAWPLEAG